MDENIKKNLLKGQNAENVVELFLSYLNEQYGVTKEELSSLITRSKEKKEEKADGVLEVPATLFSQEELCPLETLAKYLKENAGYNNARIAKVLGRDERTTWAAAKSAAKKKPSPLKWGRSNCKIPLDIFSDRTKSVLEHVTTHLKDNYSLTYHEIATMLNRDDRTIWTTYQRGKKKNNENKTR